MKAAELALESTERFSDTAMDLKYFPEDSHVEATCGSDTVELTPVITRNKLEKVKMKFSDGTEDEWTPSPMSEVQLKISADNNPAVETESLYKVKMRMIDEMYGPNSVDESLDDDYDTSPFTSEEFVEYMATALPKCESAIRAYFKKHPSLKKSLITNLKEVNSVFMKDDEVYAHMFNDTDIRFDELTIGQFVCITDEILYKDSMEK